MTSSTYPDSLPAPRTLSYTPRERRQLGDANRPLQARALERDRGAVERVTWPPFTTTQGEVFKEWWKNTLVYGGAWFVATWPTPQGRAPLVLRFRSPPNWQYVPGGFWSISAEVEVRGAGELPSAPAAFVDCELLLHFDEADPTAWIDYSTRHHAISVSNGVGGNVSAVPGVWSNQLRLDQSAPGSGAVPDYNTQAFVQADGFINLGEEDFFISFFATLDTFPSTGGQATVVSNISRGGGNSHGFEILISSIGQMGFDFNGGVPVGSILVTAGVRSHFAFSRKFNGERRVLYWYKDGIEVDHIGYDPVQDGGGSTHVGCSIRDNLSGGEARVWGFQGTIEELYIVKGPGTGVDSSFTVPTQPIGS